ncbi:uncharacterized protein LOC116413695 [Galleria mellonella]|uniref:Uncharacterized protein LOC116413695 n=1 Tax=Galleria mellonella TaxID=7137 RepID=A0ABM3MH29_GALME|nr:uncharacterized protein LOC116413695 [Galleria mellonella]
MEHARPPSELRVDGNPAVRAETWRKWWQQFAMFLKASGVNKESKEVQASLLVNLIGAEGYEVYSTFSYSKEENPDDIECLKKKFDTHFGTKVNVTSLRFKFFTRNQVAGETINQYVTALKLLSQGCEFEHLVDGLLRDRIVCGILDNVVRDRLLRAEDLTLAKAVQICEAAEMSREERRQIEEATSSGTHVDAVYGDGAPRGGGAGPSGGRRRQRGRRGGRSEQRLPREQRDTPCRRCGNTYCEGAQRCSAFRSTCFVCNGQADMKCQNILGLNACLQIGAIQRVNTLNIDNYSDLFHGLGKLPGKHKIVVNKSVAPVICPTRRIPLGMRDKLYTELKRMEKLGVVRKVSYPTEWVNAIVIAAKKNGDIRICLDPRDLNRAVQRAHYSLPTVTEVAARLRGATHFSVLDARCGFWMLELDEASADLCTFSTPYGRYQFLRLPYGINCAPEMFHGLMRQYLEDIEGTESFIDDIVVWGSSKQEHDARLEKLLQRAKEIGIRFNKEKCKFNVKEVTYLGHVFDERGMRPDSAKVKAVVDMPIPKDRKGLERFLGMVNYLSKFIPNYSENVVVLRALLKKDVEWVWGPEHTNAVNKLKCLITSAPVLALYSNRLPIVVSVDASAEALGGVVLQAGRPVEFASLHLPIYNVVMRK